MSFLTPIAFFFAASLPVVIVFYLLKRKRVVRLVSSTLLWQRFLAETQASSPFQKLRHNWLLILQLLMLALAVLALARPYFIGQAKQSKLRIIILDGSASMQSTDVEPSRFEQARAEALGWVDGLRDDEKIMVLLAGATTEVKQSPTSDKTALRRALRACNPSDGPTRLADALKTAAAFTFEQQGEESVTTGEIHLFSDGAATDLGEAANQNLPLTYHRIGVGGENLGLVALDAKAHPEDPARRAIFAAVANTSTNTLQTDITLRFDGEPVETRSLTLAPTNTQPVVFTAPQTRDGLFSLHLSIQDDLAADNQAFILSRLPSPVKILLVTRGNRFLEKALRNAALAEVTVAPSLTDDARAFDMVVFDDVAPIVWPAIHTLAIRTADPAWFERLGTARNPPIVDWRSTHSLLRFVNLDNVQIAEALSVKPPTWGVPLIESPETPLLVAGELDKRRVVWVGFDVLNSTWPLRISFPIFIANVVEWLNPANIKAAQTLLRAGEPFHLNLLQEVSSASVLTPTGESRPLPIEKETREIVFGDTARQGVYRLRAGTNDTAFCVNLLDAAESTIQPRDSLPFGKYEVVEASTVKQANLEMWRWFAGAALLVLLFEWWFYHKRTV